MKTLALFVRSTILGGVFFLAPIIVLIVILAKAFGYAKEGVHAIVVHVPMVSDLRVSVATALSIAVIALVCLLAGLIAHTMIGQRLVNALESSVLSKIPAYEYLKQESASALGVAEIGELPVVFVPMEGGVAAWRSNRNAEQWARLDLRPRRAEPAFRLSLFLFRGGRSACGNQARRRA
jgi:hypothetical protein